MTRPVTTANWPACSPTSPAEQKERIEATQAAIGRIRSRERFEEIKRQHQAGQFQTVRKRLTGLSGEVGSQRQNAGRGRRAEKRIRLPREKMEQAYRVISTSCRSWSTTAIARTFRTIAEALKAELSPEGLPRLDAFLGQAAQAERQQQEGANDARRVGTAVAGGDGLAAGQSLRRGSALPRPCNCGPPATW